ncbi:hypothetical protein ABH975_003442 [Bradyrhizobium ottawaense]|uniref:hypothetical protein n=1 Tax=Bradyrhizobium ottawaense TaxID=931866 RepID=UPI00351498E1
MGGKGGDDGGGSFTGNAAANGGPMFRQIMEVAQPPTSTTDLSPPVTPPVEPPVTPTQGDDAKTPGGDGTSPPPVGDDTGTGTDTGNVAAQTLAAPSYWFNQPISTLAPKPIPKKGRSIKTTGGSV